MERLNFIFHQAYREDFSEHRMAYDLATLSRLLRQAGFSEVAERAFDSSLDSEHRRFGSLYVQARRP